MAIRKVVKIDEDKCNGCGLCVPSCAEGAIRIMDGKARLVADNLCDGLGSCLGDCPEGAITVEERDADEFDETAVKFHLGAPALVSMPLHHHGQGGGCPGSRPMSLERDEAIPPTSTGPQPSTLGQWPVQLHLLSPVAPYLAGSDLLLAADCTAFSVGDFHSTHLRGKTLAIACPKLDQGTDVYIQKLTAMIDQSRINTLTVMIMEVPCCAGLVQIASTAIERAGRRIPLKKIVVGIKGDILSEDWI